MTEALVERVEPQVARAVELGKEVEKLAAPVGVALAIAAGATALVLTALAIRRRI